MFTSRQAVKLLEQTHTNTNTTHTAAQNISKKCGTKSMASTKAKCNDIGHWTMAMAEYTGNDNGGGSGDCSGNGH